MINPLSDVFNWFLGLWTCLPQPVSAFIMLSLSLFVITAILNMVFR